MSNVNIFQNSAKSIPTSDEQIVRIDLMYADIGGRTGAQNFPKGMKSAATLSHVPNAGSTVGK